MTNFIDIVQNIMEEQNKQLKELFENNVVSKNTFYKYKQRIPSLHTLIKIANYLHVSIDYMYERVDDNRFYPYSYNQSDFYNKLVHLIKTAGISNRKFCKDLLYSKDCISRYKNGVEPSVRTLFEIANYFDCYIDDLLSHTTKTPTM